MKIILNQDVKHLGEEGDIKDVAAGYARNYLFPRNLALPCNDVTVAYFEGKKEEIEARKEQKRKDALSLKEKLEAVTVELVLPVGPNGKLYGAVTNQTIADELNKQGYEIERKRIDVPGLTIKTVGNYHVIAKLYETTTAQISVTVKAQEETAAKETAKNSKKASNAKAEKTVKVENTEEQDVNSEVQEQVEE